MGYFGISGIMFSIIPILVLAVFGFVFGSIIAQAVRAGRRRAYNRAQPVLTVEATVISRRTEVSTYRPHHAAHLARSHTSRASQYYVTFQGESGDRMEFLVAGTEYGMLAEGDRGRLTFQGSEYQGFRRV